ncbi:CobW C-terminal domain-containing protein [Nocardiopsis lambiniae]|uniref:GTP-binding protein n=1 Tax=Nocardiopsis lambiniae TaxID=3075539 RepID=A0ABU2MBC7_9ACTN|nr:GTP-binding protein [Nocardiopsis sp. DSM 44743]MDT0329878.1 GTP-binding protein [Nocardiopsis sp. DSM 44743]
MWTEPAPRELAPLFSGRFDEVGAATRLSPVFPPVPPLTGEDMVETVVWRRFRPLHPERFYEALDEMTGASLRSRGRLWLASRPGTMLSWEAVGLSLSFEPSGPWPAALPAPERSLAAGLRGPGDMFDWHPRTGDRCRHLAFTGLGVNVPRLLSLLDSCLLSEEESIAWERHGPLCEDPFAPCWRARRGASDRGCSADAHPGGRRPRNAPGFANTTGDPGVPGPESSRGRVMARPARTGVVRRGRR